MKLSKENLIDWIDRPPSNSDLDFINKIIELQVENEQLKELCNKYKEEHNTAFKLWTMKIEEMPDYEEKMNYKSRIDKAIKETKR